MDHIDSLNHQCKKELEKRIIFKVMPATTTQNIESYQVLESGGETNTPFSAQIQTPKSRLRGNVRKNKQEGSAIEPI
jgi:hypothetical protein